MDNRPIGIFDSGLGGLSAVKALNGILPNEDIVYFGDTGRVPYGTKSKNTVLNYAGQDEAFLLSNSVKMIIAACGTVSSLAYDTGKDLGVPFYGVVEPSAKLAVSLTKNKKIGVIGTSATISSGSYEKAIKNIDSSIEVYSKACSLFVSLVEEGWIDKDDEVTLNTAERYLSPLKQAGVDTLILGCTHFPIIAPTISKVMGEGVTLISSGEACAKEVAEYLKKNDMLNENTDSGELKFYVSDTPDSFVKTAKIFLQTDKEIYAEQINIENYAKQKS